jgi:hypothetical protein
MRRQKQKATMHVEVTHRGKNRFPEDGPVTIIGLFSSPSGIGQGARLMRQDMARNGRAVTAVDVTRDLYLAAFASSADLMHVSDIARFQPGLAIVHLNPPHYNDAFWMLDKAWRRRSRLVGYWAWELEAVPPAWLRDARLCDEIWVPSDFVAAAVRNLLGANPQKPIRVVPHAVDADPVMPPRTIAMKSEARAKHNLSDATFVVGYSWSMDSNYTRKNPMGAVAAFQTAFPVSEPADVALILRCNDLERWSAGQAEVLAATKHDPRIIVFGGDGRRIGLTDFYGIIDVYLSLHRSEGYGLTLAEAADVGIDVIATGWGLASDIAARPRVASIGWRMVPVVDPQGVYTELQAAAWADPNINEAAAKLRDLRDAHRAERPHDAEPDG